MEDGKTAYVLLGIENQTDIHYAMPVKNAIYDALQYGRQVSDIAAKHRADRKDKKSEKKVSGGEYLSGFYKEDRLIPVITLVIHFGVFFFQFSCSLFSPFPSWNRTRRRCFSIGYLIFLRVL